MPTRRGSKKGTLKCTWRPLLCFVVSHISVFLLVLMYVLEDIHFLQCHQKVETTAAAENMGGVMAARKRLYGCLLLSFYLSLRSFRVCRKQGASI